MSEQLSRYDVDLRLQEYSVEIDELLLDVPEIYDGTNRNTADDVTDEYGATYGVAKSQCPEGNFNYHVRLKGSVDPSGYAKSWDFYWGHGGKSTILSRIHESRRANSAVYGDDERKVQQTIETVKMNVIVRTIVESYRLHSERLLGLTENA